MFSRNVAYCPNHNDGYHRRMMQHSLLVGFAVATSLLGCGPKAKEAETVPASILDPGSEGPAQPATRTEYKLAKKADTPLGEAPDSAYRTSSGLRFVVFKRGTNTKHPSSTTQVTVHYEGFTTDGKEFDSSVRRGEPTSFVLNQVIPGWREGVKLMTVGDTFRFWIPEKDAYRGVEGKPAGLLIFDVQLLEIAAE